MEEIINLRQDIIAISEIIVRVMSAAADLEVVRVCLKRMDFATSW